MRWKLAILILLLCTYSISFCQGNPGARQVALSYSDISSFNDAFSIFNNPAALSGINIRTSGIYYSPSPFGLKELSKTCGVFSQPTSFGNLGIGFSVYGFELYKETVIGLTYAGKLTSNFYAGVTASYKTISIKNYGSTGVLYFNLGGIAVISDKINVGFSFENINRATVADESNQLPVVYSVGISYKAIKELQVFAALAKELNYNASVRLGAEYSILNFLTLRIGTASEPNTFSSGIGLIYSVFHFDYAVTSHPDLGLTHQFGVVFRL